MTSKLFKELSNSEFKVYHFIKMWAEEHRDRMPSYEKIADELNVSRKTIQRAVVGLKDKKVIDIKSGIITTVKIGVLYD